MSSCRRQNNNNAPEKGAVVPVLFVEKRYAKHVKTTLESTGELNKDFRMVPANGKWDRAIALPIGEMKETYSVMEGVLGNGTLFCPYSTSLLGNHVGRSAKVSSKNIKEAQNLIEQALVASFRRHGLAKTHDEDEDDTLLKLIRDLDLSICPKKLEYLGDDRTLVLQRRVFSMEEPQFVSFLDSLGCRGRDSQEAFVSTLWDELASAHKSPRVVRRGAIAPSSGIRESSYRLLWPVSGVPENTGR